MTHKSSLALKGALLFGLCLALLICAYKLRSYPSSEFDEGVYLATFKAVQNGFPLYNPTYFSQPPGFFLTTFPIYALLGSTLPAARLAVFAYSLLGLLAIFWLGWEFGDLTFSFIAVGVLYLIPIYTVQIMTFHSDSIPSAFSVLGIAALLRYRHTNNRRWIGLSALAVALAVLVKVDVSAFPALAIILLATHWRDIRALLMSLGLFAVVLAVALAALTLPFGWQAVYTNVIQLRIQAAATAAPDPTLFWRFLQGNPRVIALLIAGSALSLIALRVKAARLATGVLLVWAAATFGLLMVYQPLMPHHLVLLALPAALLFAYGLAQVLDRIPVRGLMPAAMILLLLVMLWGRVNEVMETPVGVATPIELTGLDLVNKYTQSGDYIISDDGIIVGLSDRRTPPNLTDISYVRLGSGSLNFRQFKRDLETYQPKLILAWTNRLIYLQDFDSIMQEYHYQLIDNIDGQYKAYLLQAN